MLYRRLYGKVRLWLKIVRPEGYESSTFLSGLRCVEHGISKIYRSNGDNTFTEPTSIVLTGVYFGSVAWGDCDNRALEH